MVSSATTDKLHIAMEPDTEKQQEMENERVLNQIKATNLTLFTFNSVALVGTETIGSIPGLDVVFDPYHAALYSAKYSATGDIDDAISAGAYTTAIVIPLASGVIIKYALKGPVEKAMFEGGAHGRIKNLVEGGTNITERNHLPSIDAFKRAELNVVSDYLKSSHHMLTGDHKNFITTGASDLSKAFREAEATLLREGDFMGAFDLNANAIKAQYGDIYNKAIEQARKHYQDNVVPKLKEAIDNK
jgi:hypothetical protein